MRAKMLKFKAFGLLLMMVFSLVSCSDDGDDDAKTFLETNGGTVWTVSQAGASVYAQINNNESNPFEFWVSLGAGACYVHEDINEDGTVEVLENTENKFKVRVEDDLDEYTIATLTIKGNVLTVEYEYVEDGELIKGQTITFAKNKR